MIERVTAAITPGSVHTCQTCAEQPGEAERRRSRRTPSVGVGAAATRALRQHTPKTR